MYPRNTAIRHHCGQGIFDGGGSSAWQRHGAGCKSGGILPCLLPVATEQLCHIGLDGAHVGINKAWSNREDDVAGYRKQCAIEPKHFPEQSLDPVTTDRVPGLLLDADAEPAPFAFGRQKNNGKPIAPYPSASPVNALELPSGLE